LDRWWIGWSNVRWNGIEKWPRHRTLILPPSFVR
jgi:hypothetical protein